MRSIRLVALFFILSSTFAAAVIARDGSCSATGTSCTLSGTATGSLKVVFAFRTTGATPTLATGYTAVAQKANVNSGWAVGCNVSSSGADTGTGTWTNATSVVAISYSGTAATTTAECPFTGLGVFAQGTAATSTLASYTTISMASNRNDDWVVGFLGGSASSVCVPAGMTSVSTTGTILASDTNATVTSWSTTTCAVSSENWSSLVIEIRGPATVWTTVQRASCSALTGTAVCNITVTSTGTGHVMIVTAAYGNTGATISSITGGGAAWVHPAGCVASDATLAYASDAFYSLSSTSGSTTIAVNISGNSTGTWGAQFIELSFTGSVAFDACGIKDNSAAATPQPGAAVTLSGTTDVIAQVSTNSVGYAAGVAGQMYPYGPITGATANARGVWLLNTSNGFAPLWQISVATQSIATGIAIKAVTAATCHNALTLLGVGCN